MKKFNYKGYQIEVFNAGNGEELYISKGGSLVYSARVHKGDAMSRIKAIVSRS